MNAYSRDLRERILKGRQEGQGAGELAKRYRVSRRTVERYWKVFLETGRTTAQRIGGHRRSRLEGHDTTLRQWIRQEPGLTLQELQTRCRTQIDVRLCVSALANRLAKLGLSYKKNPVRRRARPARH